VVAGTPDTVLKKLRFLKDELNMGHLVFYGQESRMSHDATMRSIELFGKEVMPAIREVVGWQARQQGAQRCWSGVIALIGLAAYGFCGGGPLRRRRCCTLAGIVERRILA
jgi:hypothetical protein